MRLTSLLVLAAVTTFSSCCMPCTQSVPKIGDLEESSWKLIELDNKPIENSAIALTFDAASKTFFGEAPCNKFFGSYNLYAPKKGERKNITLGQIGATMRACEDTEIEERFTYLLPSISRVQIEGENLLMFNPGDSLMAVLVRRIK